jgi:hypothetical protein
MAGEVSGGDTPNEKCTSSAASRQSTQGIVSVRSKVVGAAAGADQCEVAPAVGLSRLWGERGRLSGRPRLTRPGAESTEVHSPQPRPPAGPHPDLGRAESGHEPAFIHLAPPWDVGREGDAAPAARKPRTKRPDQDRRETPPRTTDEAGGGPAPKAPGPASPAGGGAVRATGLIGVGLPDALVSTSMLTHRIL